MKNKPSILFPVFRKYSNNKSFFKIISKSEFEEIKFLNEKAELHCFTAKILPDFNFINDMIENHNNHWVESNEEEFKKMKLKI